MGDGFTTWARSVADSYRAKASQENAGLLLCRKERINIAKKQVLVVKCNVLMSQEKRDIERQKIIKQLEEGVVLLPSGYDALTVDVDQIVIGDS